MRRSHSLNWELSAEKSATYAACNTDDAELDDVGGDGILGIVTPGQSSLERSGQS